MRDNFHSQDLRMHPGSPAGSGGGSSPRTPSSERAMPDALRGPAFDHVRDMWAEARRQRDPELPAFSDALVALARHARQHGLEVSELLKALDSVTRPESGGEPSLDWDHVREIAGRIVIRAYYRDD